MWKLIDPYRWLIAGVVLFALIAGSMWVTHRLKEQGREEVRRQVKAEAEAQIEAAKRTSDNLLEIKDEAIENATLRAQENAAAAARARTELARLRQQVASAPSMPGDSCAAAIDRAAALGELLGDCAQRYSDVAAKADAHASDALTLHQAWPVINRDSLDQQRNQLRKADR